MELLGDLGLLEIVLVAGIAFGGGVAQGFLGFGYSVLTIPLLRLIHPLLAPFPQVLVGLVLAAGGAWREREHLEWHGVGTILIGRVPGAAIGAWIVGVVTARTLDLVTAGVVLGGVVLMTSNLHIHQTGWTRLTVGAVSGFSGTASAMSGPPLALFYNSHGRSEARASLGLIFSVGAVISMVALIWSGVFSREHLLIGLALLVPTGLGFRTTRGWIQRADEAVLRGAVLAVSALAGLALLARALDWI